MNVLVISYSEKYKIEKARLLFYNYISRVDLPVG